MRCKNQLTNEQLRSLWLATTETNSYVREIPLTTPSPSASAKLHTLLLKIRRRHRPYPFNEQPEDMIHTRW